MRLGRQPVLASAPMDCASFKRATFAGEGVEGAEHPAVVVVAAHHPTESGASEPLHHRDHVIDRLQPPVGF